MVGGGIKHYIRTFLVGGIMGVANIIPGVSGGTMAVVFGIYEDLMEALSNFLTNRQKRWQYIRFLAVLFIGAVVVILLLSRVLAWCFDHYPLMTVYFFMGLILGSIPVVVRTHHDMKMNMRRIVMLICGIALVVILALLQTDTKGQGNTFNYLNIGLLDYLFFVVAGALAASAMIIPGLSGSFILLLLGAYRTVLDSISGLTDTLIGRGLTDTMRVRLLILLALGAGIVIGIIGFARLMNWALKHYPAVTMYLILGLILGSFYQLYPGFTFNWNGAGSLLTFVIGLFISLKFGEEKAPKQTAH
ncbi:MAG: DUF368 domain-containing protein [Caldithrix sp.]|nr:DUF368 domain-containing protein [Caldithrix sp.]